MNRSLSIFAFFFLFSTSVNAQERTIHFPDVASYHTLLVDLHIHTVFSDGSVWPNIRVQEAWLDGLDAIAITDHIEYTPHSHDIPFEDRNRSYEVALNANGQNPLIVINGAEITRNMPPGHVNAIFMDDVTPLKELSEQHSRMAFEEAQRQGAFIFWNHPNWTAQRRDGIARMDTLHEELIDEGLLHGIEVVNEGTFSEEALAIALENELTILATSDIHGIVDWQFEIPNGGHRPVTLAFAVEHSKEGLHEALKMGRTIAYFKNNLIGREEVMSPLLDSSLVVTEATYPFTTDVLGMTIENRTSTPFTLNNTSEYSLHEHTNLIRIPAHSSIAIQVKTEVRMEEVLLTFDVLNAFTAPGENPSISFSITP